jgi:hypothetical protein
MLEQFNIKAKCKMKLELYHCSDDYKNKYKSIFKNGFFKGPASNKGYGIYLSSHSNYSYKWGGRDHVIVCEVIVDENLVSKYYSEVFSPKNNWEFVVKDKSLIYPKYLIEYESDDYKYDRYWTRALCYNCSEVKKSQNERYRRCDCPQFPVIVEENLT